MGLTFGTQGRCDVFGLLKEPDTRGSARSSRKPGGSFFLMLIRCCFAQKLYSPLMPDNRTCPKCDSDQVVRSGIVQDRQRYRCKKCGYHFTVNKLGKRIDNYYVVKALQLHLEGVSLREIERLLGVSHVSVLNWVRQYHIKVPEQRDYRPSYKVLDHAELVEFMRDKAHLSGAGMVVTELGDKFMVIRWERIRKD